MGQEKSFNVSNSNSSDADFQKQINNLQIASQLIQEQQAELVQQSNNLQIVSDLVQSEQSEILEKISVIENDDKATKTSLGQLEKDVLIHTSSIASINIHLEKRFK